VLSRCPASSSGRQGQPAVCRPRERLDGYFFAAFDELIPLAKKVGTALYVENMPFALIADVEGLMQALGRCGNDDIGIVYDAANKEIGYKRPPMLEIIAPDAEKGILASAGTACGDGLWAGVTT
jgi:sugar phosphate isomerase/epimerase